jgi:hypothetical protein
MSDEFSIHKYEPEAVLVEFASSAAADKVLHAGLPVDAPFPLIWKRWRRQAGGNLALVQLMSIPDHARNMKTAQIILGNDCSNLVAALANIGDNDRSSFYVVAWCMHPDVIPTERPRFILPVRKKPEVGEKRVYRISRKFFGFVVFLSDKNLEKKSSIYKKTT